VKIEATAKEIRALLSLARLNAAADKPILDADRRAPDAVRRRIPSLLLERYHSLLAAGRRPAVVAIERGACSGCHVRLPTMLEYQASRLLALYTCPHCRRMVYAQELLRKNFHAGANASFRGAPPAGGRS
jgi:predicted  nucleic acid-binding Zn-ribbon protein